MRELADREAEARQRVREMDAPQRQKLEATLAELASSAKTTTATVQRLRDDVASHRMPWPAASARLEALARQQAQVRQRATAVQQRLAALDQREERATDVVDRIAQNTGLGKPKFSF